MTVHRPMIGKPIGNVEFADTPPFGWTRSEWRNSGALVQMVSSSYLLRMLDERILDEVSAVLASQGRLIRLAPDRITVFVGDTHGDLDATERVFSRYLSPDRTIVFLGDAVDRGPHSADNLRLILETKLKYPDSVFLLMGNHEAYGILPFSPADFWERLPPLKKERIAKTLLQLPFAAWHPLGLVGLHGALPNVGSVAEIERIELGSEEWRAMTWGDWTDEGLGVSGISLRPTYGRSDFEERADRLGIKVLVRSHQPSAPAYMFDGRCLTVFTSSAYGRGERSVALLHPDRRLGSGRDLELVGI